MPTLATVMAELKAKGNEKTRIIYSRHGMPIERTYGVSVADLKVISKAIKKQQDLACELYETGNVDAMYLSGMVTDGAQLTRERIDAWAEAATGVQMIAETTIPWIALDRPDARELAVAWMKSSNESVAATGWCTYSALVSVVPDDALDLAEIEGLLGTAVKEIPGASNRLRLKMNSFVIAVGCYVLPLKEKAKAAAQQIGAVSADMGNTACKIPLATEYIAKVESSGKVGQKKKTVRC